jgi:hypothetical protein
MRRLIFVFRLFLPFVLILGCEKATVQGPYEVSILVSNDKGIPIQNGSVRVFAPIGADGTINYYLTTDENGMASFEYKHPAYLRMDATKLSWKGCGFVELSDESAIETTIVMKPYFDPDNGCPP